MLIWFDSQIQSVICQHWEYPWAIFWTWFHNGNGPNYGMGKG